MNYLIIHAVGFGVALIIAIIMIQVFSLKESNSIALVGQYTVSNYTSANDTFKVFLFAKEKLNESVILENDNDITERILIARIVPDW